MSSPQPAARSRGPLRPPFRAGRELRRGAPASGITLPAAGRHPTPLGPRRHTGARARPHGGLSGPGTDGPGGSRPGTSGPARRTAGAGGAWPGAWASHTVVSGV
nr:hypothetical protein StreXyl84_31340 [Streptomyces sp. Xyl84]